MAVSLKKGGSISLTKDAPALKKILVGLGWKESETDGEDFDLDASAFMVKDNGKVRSDKDFIFYGQLESSNGAVQHQGDELSGGTGDEDSEQIHIDLEKIPDLIKRIVFTVTIYEADDRGQNFGQVESAYIRIVNRDNGKEIVRFDLSEDYDTETAMIFGEVYRHNNEWKFKAVGEGVTGSLGVLCEKFGVEVAD